MDENVLVLPATLVQKHLERPFCDQSAEAVIALANEHALFLPRSRVETDESVKQIIPYALIRHGTKCLLLRRTSRQSEARLHDKFSLGIGGHINEMEASSHPGNLVEGGFQRELQEEISLHGSWKHRAIGTIYDGSNAVGRVHLGVAFLVETDAPGFTLNEPDLMSASWIEQDCLLEHKPKMETWSQILLENFFSVEVSA